MYLKIHYIIENDCWNPLTYIMYLETFVPSIGPRASIANIKSASLYPSASIATLKCALLYPIAIIATLKSQYLYASGPPENVKYLYAGV